MCKEAKHVDLRVHLGYNCFIFFFSLVFSIVINLKKWLLNNFMILGNDKVIKISPLCMWACINGLFCSSTERCNASLFYNILPLLPLFPKPFLLLCITINIFLIHAHMYMHYINFNSCELHKFNSYELWILFYLLFSDFLLLFFIW